MTSTTILTILLVFSFVIGRFLRQFETPHFVFSGMIYLIFGLLLGSHMGLGVLSKDLLYQVEPMRDLMTGIVGFLLGLRVPIFLENRRIFLSGAMVSSLVFVLVAIALFFITHWAVDFSDDQFIDLTFLHTPFLTQLSSNRLWFSLGVSATACSASLLSLGMVSKLQKSESQIAKALSIMAPTGQLAAVAFMGISLAFAQSNLSARQLDISMGTWVLATLSSGLLCAIIFSLFVGHQSNQNRVMLAALGAIIFAAGLGGILNVSSIFVCFLTGMTISLFSSYQNILKENLVRLEEPIFVLLLVIGGASWQPELNRSWLLPASYFIIRAIIFSSMGQWFYNQVTQKKLTRLGQGLLGQDLVAVAIALSLAKEFPKLSQLFLTTILGSIFLNDIVANTLLKKVLLDNEQDIKLQPIEAQEGSK